MFNDWCGIHGYRNVEDCPGCPGEAPSAASRRFKGVVRSVKKAEPRLSLSKEETEAAITATEYQEARPAAQDRRVGPSPPETRNRRGLPKATTPPLLVKKGIGNLEFALAILLFAVLVGLFVSKGLI